MVDSLKSCTHASLCIYRFRAWAHCEDHKKYLRHVDALCRHEEHSRHVSRWLRQTGHIRQTGRIRWRIWPAGSARHALISTSGLLLLCLRKSGVSSLLSYLSISWHLAPDMDGDLVRGGLGQAFYWLGHLARIRLDEVQYRHEATSTETEAVKHDEARVET